MNSTSAGGRKGNGSHPEKKKSARQKQVERLKGKVEKGVYRVEAKKVADKMVDDAVRAIRSRDRSG